MKIRGVSIKTDRSVEVVTYDHAREYDTLRDAVGGRVEHVALKSPGERGVSMWVNEEGKIIGLPVNRIATMLWTESFGPTDVMVGNVFITGSTDAFGDSTDLTDAEIAAIMEMV